VIQRRDDLVPFLHWERPSRTEIVLAIDDSEGVSSLDYFHEA